MAEGKILVVDDEADALKFLELELTNAGYEIVKAMNGAEAIYAAAHVAPDLILMDVMLPDMNGAEAVKMIKDNPKTKDIPVLFLTAMLTKSEQTHEKLGFNVDDQWYDAIAKPFYHEELLKKIAAALRG